MKTILAQIVSRMFGPEAVVPLYFIALLVLKGRLSSTQITHLTPALLFFDWLLPLISLVILFKLGRVSDFDLVRRSERPLILIIALLSLSLGTIFTFFWGNTLVFNLQVILLSLVAVLTGITLFYKISFHSGINTFLFLVLNYLYNWRLAWVFVWLIPIAWARWQLKKHTLPQLVLGIIIGLAISLTGIVLLF